MSSSNSRNREHRTKSKPAAEITAIRVKLSRDDYDQVKALERRKVFTKEEIFQIGLRTCMNQ